VGEDRRIGAREDRGERGRQARRGKCQQGDDFDLAQTEEGII